MLIVAVPFARPSPNLFLCRGWTQSSKHTPSRLSVVTGSVSFGANRILVSPQRLRHRRLHSLPWPPAWGVMFCSGGHRRCWCGCRLALIFPLPPPPHFRALLLLRPPLQVDKSSNFWVGQRVRIFVNDRSTFGEQGWRGGAAAVAAEHAADVAVAGLLSLLRLLLLLLLLSRESLELPA
jgi:hypothetical protein